MLTTCYRHHAVLLTPYGRSQFGFDITDFNDHPLAIDSQGECIRARHKLIPGDFEAKFIDRDLITIHLFEKSHNEGFPEVTPLRRENIGYTSRSNRVLYPAPAQVSRHRFEKS